MAYPILSGAEAFSFPGGDVGVILLHGFTGSPQGLGPWGEALRNDGHTILCPLLTGHGTPREGLGRRPCGRPGRRQRGSPDRPRRPLSDVVICSLSFGSALVLHLAATQPEQVAGLITVSVTYWSDPGRRPWQAAVTR